MGQIGVIVAMNGSNEEFGCQVAMHIAAANPAALDEGSLDPELVEREKVIPTEQARESGKPEAVIEKMIVGRMKKFLGEVTLLGQDFVVNPDAPLPKPPRTLVLKSLVTCAPQWAKASRKKKKISLQKLQKQRKANSDIKMKMGGAIMRRPLYDPSQLGMRQGSI